MAYSDVILAESALQSYWRLNDAGSTAIDSEGSIDGTYDGLVTRQATGLIATETDYACSVVRTDGAGIYWGDNYGFTGTANFTIELWFKPAVVDGTVSLLANKWDNGAGGWVLDYWDGGTRFRRYDSGGVDDACTAAAMSADTTYHLVVTYDGSDIKVYLNAGAPTTQASTRSIGAATNPLALGRYGGGGSGSSGTLDEFAIYNAALSATAITTHYDSAYGQVLHPDADTAAGGWAAFGTASLWEATSDSSDSTYMLGTAS